MPDANYYSFLSSGLIFLNYCYISPLLSSIAVRGSHASSVGDSMFLIIVVIYLLFFSSITVRGSHASSVGDSVSMLLCMTR